jgi:hypothetical protein
VADGQALQEPGVREGAPAARHLTSVRDRKIMRYLRATEAHRRTGRLLRWVLVVTLGEAIGFMVPAVVGAGIAAASRQLPILIAMVLAGAVEGAVLGAAQS